MEENLIKIKEILEELLKIMDFSGVVIFDDKEEDFLRINIESNEAGYLIGHNGENLRALQQISRALVSKKIEIPPRFIIDVNNYQKSRLSLLQEMAQNLAREVVARQSPQWLNPMNSYERRVIHLALKDIKGIKTESEGEGESRRVIIKPI
jgi:spoIIIJ-associated protein